MDIVFQVPVAFIEKDGQLLLVQEKTGHWSFCGGAMESNDASLESALARELHEELSLTPSQYIIKEKLLESSFVYDDQRSKHFGRRGVMHVYKVDLIGPLQPTDEIVGAAWISIEEAREKISRQEKNILEELLTP